MVEEAAAEAGLLGTDTQRLVNVRMLHSPQYDLLLHVICFILPI
jgi:hypothetical protein